MSTDKDRTSNPIFSDTPEDLLSQWAEGGTLGRLERAKAQVESLGDAAARVVGNGAVRIKDILLLTIEDAIVQVEQDDAFIDAMAQTLKGRASA